jgi:O-methyltransferase involved in polyketide biosynthesis
MVPNAARMYSFWLGGKDYLAPDRQAATAVLAEYPVVGQLARASRDFVGRAVRHVAATGIEQFLDIGVGLPSSSAVLPFVQRLRPTARTAYVDNDPVVLSHARALAARPGVEVICGDLREPAGIAENPDLHSLIDVTQPACLILTGVLHFLQPGEADKAVAFLTGLLAAGSYLIISAGTSTGTSPAFIDRVRAAYQGSTVVTARTSDEIQAWFTGLELLSPGVTDVHRWRPDSLWHWPATDQARVLGGVARKPGHPDDSPGPGTAPACPRADRGPQ